MKYLENCLVGVRECPTATKRTSVQEVIAKMSLAGQAFCLILGEENNLKSVQGLVTKGDLLVAYAAGVRHDQSVGEIVGMQKEGLISCHKDASVEEVAELMSKQNVNFVVIFDENNDLCGVVPSWDLARKYASEKNAWPFPRTFMGLKVPTVDELRNRAAEISEKMVQSMHGLFSRLRIMTGGAGGTEGYATKEGVIGEEGKEGLWEGEQKGIGKGYELGGLGEEGRFEGAKPESWKKEQEPGIFEKVEAGLGLKPEYGEKKEFEQGKYEGVQPEFGKEKGFEQGKDVPLKPELGKEEKGFEQGKYEGVQPELGKEWTGKEEIGKKEFGIGGIEPELSTQAFPTGTISSEASKGQYPESEQLGKGTFVDVLKGSTEAPIESI